MEVIIKDFIRIILEKEKENLLKKTVYILKVIGLIQIKDTNLKEFNSASMEMFWEKVFGSEENFKNDI